MKPLLADRCPLRIRCKDKEDFRINKEKLILFSKIYGLEDETIGFLARNPPFRDFIDWQFLLLSVPNILRS